ncbi:hypothetical protein QWZ08_20045 [Ferruginibacter paludis]|uniref:hypothetical protein n=1 Tax=Ferruginibacter paludis TaxID=1310417 RepID=UPI0025B4188B|nr:hypothetical protein [Ferruginibacter paludis]MDN3657956.1 hypothetical protein [Ferruginibacter paludis]
MNQKKNIKIDSVGNTPDSGDNFIGTVLRFDKLNFEANLKRYDALISATNRVMEIYEALDPTFVFSQETWLDMVKNGTTRTEIKYEGIIRMQLDSAKLTAKAIISATDSIAAKNLDELKLALQKVADTLADEFTNSRGLHLLDLTFIEIKDGIIGLSAEGTAAIRFKYEDIITTETQNEFYIHLLKVQSAYSALRKFMLEKTVFEINHSLIGNTAADLLHENADGNLSLNPYALGFLK